ncbi:hypothetical protein PPL_04182 [Heterostelium album PN500]|uniref:Uncharacterized protein n=1 Tax=Heterostelium pallidum (strain ATCC 26659 / Pp 5 / PN500) TaxID=670386 RepID=D3B691_HETP5|nr:hypothetical protein PPL_04182 [Heterostelium album PN500]EFA83389.1 hypothetical protein PPL_04182 [Heterostelium album PN500]|eukprot:XP_020435506.1 hypothetical protein PPL_04182 [Heterostelium album PN500]
MSKFITLIATLLVLLLIAGNADCEQTICNYPYLYLNYLVFDSSEGEESTSPVFVFINSETPTDSASQSKYIQTSSDSSYDSESTDFFFDSESSNLPNDPLFQTN